LIALKVEDESVRAHQIAEDAPR